MATFASARTGQHGSLRAAAVAVLLLAAGVTFAVVSVYSNTRGACATWVALAVIFTLAAGLVAPHNRRS